MTKFPGTFFDGESARKHQVEVEAEALGLAIQRPDREIPTYWPTADLRAARTIRAGHSTELTCATTPDARLIVDDPAFAGLILKAADHLSHDRGYTRRWWERPWAVAALIIAVIAGVALSVPLLAGPLARAVPDTWREAMSNSTEQALLSVSSECSTPTGDAALSKLIETLEPKPVLRPKIKIMVVDGKLLNAFALPGGKIVVMKKLLNVMETEAEFAGVLAHEIGHIAERHPTKAAIRATGLSLFLSMLIGNSSQIAEFSASLGVQALESSYSRADEAAADRIGTELLRAAGADPGALAATFERLQKVQEATGKIELGRIGAFLNTHPPYDERIAAARAQTKTTAKPLLTAPEWQAIKSICEQENSEQASAAADEVGDQAVDLGSLFQMHHVAGAI